MRKRLLFIICLCAFVFSSFADEQRKIVLNADHQKEMIRYAFCNIFVTNESDNNDEYANISINIENIDESNGIFLFGHSYPEKDLKKLTPSITYDKYFPGTKGGRVLDTFQGPKNVVFIAPASKSFVHELQVKNGDIQKCRLPLYIAKYKGKNRNKMLLLEKQVIELELEYEVKADQDLFRLNNDCDSLMKELEDVSFCNNRRHKPSLEKQERPFKECVERIKTEVDSIIETHRWQTTDKRYLAYDSLKIKLREINFSRYERDCGKHSVSKGHQCKYCSLSLQQIYNKLDDYYIKIYNSNDRKKARAAVINEVNQLYRCCTDGNCRNHSSAWKKSEYRSKIIDRYNRINNF